MKHIYVIAIFAGVLAGCTALQAPSARRSDAATDFFNPSANQAYYEFSASPLDRPSVLDEVVPETEPAEETIDNDEDFTAENVTGAYGTYGDVVVTVATHKFKLGEQATRKEMQQFQQALEAGYTAARGQYHPVGFTYAMSSVGIVNPLSDIEVTCKMSERSANQVGQATCRSFFNVISRRVAQISGGR